MRPWLAALLLLPLLAGCSDPGPSAPDATEAKATATTGVLRGVVVDEAIRPLEGALVTVPLSDGSARNATTDAAGEWAVDGLAPGFYVVQASRRGYFDQAVTANVTAGVDAPPLVKIVLLVDQVAMPQLVEVSFDGFLQCSATLVAARAAVCNPAQSLTPLCGLGVPCEPFSNLTEDRFIVAHTFDRAGIAFLQSEMQWETSGVGDGLRAVPGSRDPADGQVNDFRAFEGPSPLVMPMQGAVANGLFLGNGKEYIVRVFSGYMQGTAPPCLPSPVGCQGGVGVAFQQRFQVYTHVFYGFEPPEGWQFGRDGRPEVPA